MKNGEPGWIQERQEQLCRNMYQLLDLIGEDKHKLPVESCLTPGELCALLTRASAAPIGSFVEVGVYKGGSALFLSKLAERQQRRIFLYDTFTGMPHFDPSVDTIALGCVSGPNDTSFERVKTLLGDYPYIEACTFPNAKVLPQDVAFAHIDVDQYQSHIETCRALEPRMVKGGIMYFDDVPVLASARKAVRELYGDQLEIGEYGRWFMRF